MQKKKPLSDKNKSVGDLPIHVAIIMDGNGRWAKLRGLPRVEGHREGMNSVRAIVRHAGKLGIPYLTLYAFSTENWRRPRQEVSFLMNLLIEYFKKELNELHKQGVCIKMIGERKRVPEKVLKSIDKAVLTTKENTGLKLNIAFNYGSRQEILDAVTAYIKQGTDEPLTEEVFSSYLYTASIPDPDLLIRTSGEMRISNFLLWQLAYAELVVTPVLWPDFREKQFEAALTEYKKRERRYGGLGGQV